MHAAVDSTGKEEKSVEEEMSDELIYSTQSLQYDPQDVQNIHKFGLRLLSVIVIAKFESHVSSLKLQISLAEENFYDDRFLIDINLGEPLTLAYF